MRLRLKNESWNLEPKAKNWIFCKQWLILGEIRWVEWRADLPFLTLSSSLALTYNYPWVSNLWIKNRVLREQVFYVFQFYWFVTEMQWHTTKWPRRVTLSGQVICYFDPKLSTNWVNVAKWCVNIYIKFWVTQNLLAEFSSGRIIL